MNQNILFWIAIGSILLGLIKYKQVFSGYDFKEDKNNTKTNAPWQYKFAEIWNDSVNFFLGGLVAYYFYSVRWTSIAQDQPLHLSDFVLFLIFVMSMFGHLSVLSLNITKGVEAILDRILRR